MHLKDYPWPKSFNKLAQTATSKYGIHQFQENNKFKLYRHLLVSSKIRKRRRFKYGTGKIDDI